VKRRCGVATDTRGAAAIEFAILAPTLCLLLVGGFDVAHSLYMRGVMQGVLQKTARDGALESGGAAAQQAAIDAKVRKQVLNLHKGATVTFKRRFYRNFSEAAAAAAEPLTDSNGNGRCDNGEQYQDNNNNNTWDADGGNEGQGGAKDRVLYTVTASYPRLLPLHKFLPLVPPTEVVTASAALINQPYTDQGTYGAPTPRNCA
jgi:Flp pilus assembly protein TadG